MLTCSRSCEPPSQFLAHPARGGARERGGRHDAANPGHRGKGRGQRAGSGASERGGSKSRGGSLGTSKPYVSHRVRPRPRAPGVRARVCAVSGESTHRRAPAHIWVGCDDFSQSPTLQVVKPYSSGVCNCISFINIHPSHSGASLYYYKILAVAQGACLHRHTRT